MTTIAPTPTEEQWPPAHSTAETEHFIKVRDEGGVYQAWFVSKHDGGKFVQHNYADGTYKAFVYGCDDEVDSGTWLIKDGAYSEDSNGDFKSAGKLVGDPEQFHMDVECGPHGYHKYTPTFESYVHGVLESTLPPPQPFDENASPLTLVKKGSIGAAVFEHGTALAEGESFVPLTLKGSDGLAIVLNAPRCRSLHHGRFKLCTPAIGNAQVALRARLDQEGGHLTLESNGFILDVDHWRYEEYNKLWFLQDGDDVKARQTRNPDGGRSFILNEDSTLSPKKAPSLVLGIPSIAQLCLVEKGSERACAFEHAAALKESGSASPLTLSSHAGLAVVTKYESPKTFGDYCEYIELGVAPVSKEHPAVVVTYDADTWLCRDTVVISKQVTYKGEPLVEPESKEYTMAFDVAFGKMEKDNGVNMLQRLGAEETKEEGNTARAFMINSDGTVSPKEAPQLVLGMQFVPRAL